VSTPRHLTANLQAEFVILHRAGSTPVSDDYLAHFIAQSMPYRMSKDFTSEERLLWLVSKLARLIDRQPDRNALAGEISSLLTQVQADALTR